MNSRFRYGISKVIKHPQGTYRVAYRDKTKSLGNSALLWFKNKKGRFVPDEDDEGNRRELAKLKVKR